MDFSVSSGLAEQIAAYLEDRIIRLEIKPGQRIREAAVAEELGVSRSPVREALRILENNLVVELIPRRGARVTVISETFICDLCDVLAELLGLVGSKCPVNGIDEELAVIDEAAKRSWTCANNGDLDGYYTAVLDFCMACLKAAKNQLLEQMITELLPNLRRIIYASFLAMGDTIKTNADTVITGNNYVQQRNPEMAEKTVRDYIMRMRAFALENNAAAILFDDHLSRH
ncbi:DNA-binding GntR family transcriptional regulator [Desulfosalsimonas propionicica]|uniref:DNA-binding GntR family transcriptional regulator n=1 Tax=Desulfosalsimonas propionicica TaxID=332175 RepID=A0A7W0C6S3_9BACT|nr:GntR family transcriptional regulator [Desulfosalsimonas propionicica]MBA2880209.1 DNA-binding GntR family transcriptional regulator [Desulfosalsimonas propionicica]